MLNTTFDQILTPSYRYKHAGVIHAARVGFAVLASLLLTTAIGLPHGIWSPITVLVVIGGLQHHGNVRRRAVERGLGTLIGAAAGLLLILQQRYLGVSIVTYLLIATASGICAYFAIGRGGYIALLAAITIIIVAGNGENTLDTGLWRTVDILIGIAIALLFSFALPLYATWSWRYTLAEVLRNCAVLRAGIAKGVVLSSGEDSIAMTTQTGLLVDLRHLMPWVAKETAIDLEMLEDIQSSLRLCVYSLGLMISTRRRIGKDESATRTGWSLAGENRDITVELLGMARALELGKTRWLHPRRPAHRADPKPSLDGYALLDGQFSDETHHLRQLLSDTASRWNI